MTMVDTATPTPAHLSAAPADVPDNLPEAFRQVLETAEPEDQIIWVPISQTGQVVPINVTKCHANAYAEALYIGMKAIVNRAATKLTVRECGTTEKVAEARMTKASEQLEKIMDGSVRTHAAKTKEPKVPANIAAEARKIARADLEDQMRANGMNPGHFPARMLTAAAKAHLAKMPQIMKLAEENVKRRQELPRGDIDLSMLGAPDPKLQAASTARKAKTKAAEPKQAQLPIRQRPAPATHASH